MDGTWSLFAVGLGGSGRGIEVETIGEIGERPDGMFAFHSRRVVYGN